MRNLIASKRGWGWDEATNSLDVHVGGTITSKVSAVNENPCVYTTSTTQLYDLGTRLAVGEQVFRYCRAGSALTRYVAGCNDDQWSVTNAACTATSAVAAKTVTVGNTTATADLYKGGYLAIFTSPLQVRRIVSHTASDGTSIVCTIDGPLEAAVTSASTWVTGYPNIYYDVTAPPSSSGSVDYISFVCVPVCTVASASYFWGQTWGPCYGVAGATVPGSAANQREIYFSTAGNLWDYGDASAGTGAQYAGYILPRTGLAAGDQFYMLQLAP
jgi:hypothetical protein